MPPLQGITVLDFTTLLPGPLAALMLAEAGATVIKVEMPRGDDMRRFPPWFRRIPPPLPRSTPARDRHPGPEGPRKRWPPCARMIEKADMC
jgi:crotonobetainyl-CoA:carnitine CoA-transferase CaiB-like acyl-CoA transferase